MAIHWRHDPILAIHRGLVALLFTKKGSRQPACVLTGADAFLSNQIVVIKEIASL